MTDESSISSSQVTKPFVSLKWETLFVISVVFSLAVSVVSYVLYTEGSRFFETQLAESIRNNSTALLAQNRRNLVSIGTSISFNSRGADTVRSDKVLVDYLNQNWELMEIEWGLESISIYDVASQSSELWGEKQSFDPKTRLQSSTHKGPFTDVICTDYCSIYAIVPMFYMSGEKKYLILGTGLVDFVMNFASNNNMKAVLLRPIGMGGTSADDRVWDYAIAGMTERMAYLPIVHQLADQSDFNVVQEVGETMLTPDKQYYYLYAMPLQDQMQQTDYLLLANNITDKKQRINDTLLGAGLIAALGLVSAILLVFFVLNDPMKRIQRQANLLPLLAKKRFKGVRERTIQDRKPHYLRNELDVLEDTAIELSSELELLHREIEQRTGELENMALYDVLTGLANRRMFVEQLNILIKNSQEHLERFAVVFIDLDNFKRINDTLGHDVGDELLIEVSRRLRSSVRDTDVVARLGGDEFTLLLTQLKSIDYAKTALDKVLDGFQKPVLLNNIEYKITPSIGAAIGPDNGMDSDDLMRCADMAMYKSKRNGKNCYYFFTDEMNETLQKEIRLEGELLEAVNSKEFRLFYQPIVDLNTGKVVALEGLLRWLHPEKGLLEPWQFIDMLENNGQIVALGSQIIELACLGKIYLNNLGLEKLLISLNVSAKQFNDPLFLDKFQNVLNAHGIHPTSFKIEITEQTLMTDIEKQAKQLDILRKMGFRIAIDDFGTGYSSLSYLKELPLHILKIDRSFIKDIPKQKNDMEIVSAVTAMAKKLNLRVIAEGIETSEHEAFLKGIDCDFGQGYLYSKPKPLEELIVYLRENV